MKKKKLISLLLAGTLSVALFITSMPAQIVRADEEYESELLGEGEENPEERPVEAPDTGFMYVSPINLSFGTQTIGGDSDSQRIGITNNGYKSHTFNYVLNDAAGAFNVSFDSSLSYEPGDTAYMQVSFNPYASEGFHDATLNIQGYDSTGYIESQSVYLSIELVNKSPQITNVLVTPQQISATAGANIYFNAAVEGLNNPNRDVTWSVRNNYDSSTHITQSGELIIGGNETSEELYVTATSVQDPNWSDVAVVKVAREKFTISTQPSPSNGGTTAGGGTFNRGDSTTIYASNANGFNFDGWYLNGNKVSGNNEYRVNGINANQTYEARFVQNQVYVKVKKNIDDGGKVTDSQNIKMGSNITLNATPNKGYKFDCWKENDKNVSSSPSFQINNITTNRTFTACFARNEYKISLSAYPEKAGVVEGAGYYAVGKDGVIKATPVEGYEFVNWTENGVPFSTSNKVTVSKIGKDYNFVANFKKKDVKMYTMLSAVTSNHGVILPSGNTQAQQGSSLVYTIAANDGYRISNVAVDGKQVGAVSSYTFNNINANHQIAVAFVPIEQPKKTSNTQSTETKKTETKKTETKKPVEQKVVIETIPEVEPQKVSDTEVYEEVEPEQIIIDADMPDQGSDEDLLEHVQATGALQTLNLTEEEAIAKINAKDSRDIYEAALVNGDLKVTINNDYADSYQETMYSSYYNNVSVPNFEDVLDALLTTDQKLKIAKGESQYEINLNILDADDQMSVVNKQLIQDMKGKDMAIGTYFNILLMQDFEGVSSLISELPHPMTMVMNVPEKFKSDDRTYSIIRLHMEKDGSMSVTELKDEDNDPNTVTFTTDKFSYYALGFRDSVNGVSTLLQAKTGDARANVLILLTLLVLVAIVVTVIVYVVQYIRRPRRYRRRR